MYLDKPMRDHVLLQAIARVNRPYEDKDGKHKPSGFILDFVGIFSNLKKALAFDSQDIEGVVDDVELLKERFEELITSARDSYLKISKDKRKDKAIEAILEYFHDSQRREEFYNFYKELADIFDIISPDKFLRPFLKDYEFLTRIYKIIKDAYEPSISIDREFSRKTAQLVQQHTHGGKIKDSLDVYEINENTLDQLEKSNSSDTEKIFNLVKSMHKTIKDQGNEQPYLISIGEKANNIVESYKAKQKSTKDTLEELKELIQEVNQARREQAEKNMPVEIFTIFWELKTRKIKDSEYKANQMQDVIRDYPHWPNSKTHEREVKKELYKLMLKDKDKKVSEVSKMVNEIFDNLKLGQK
jgi:type I restriction enzyme R subunit